MRRIQFRVVRPIVLALTILSCATENAVGPTLRSSEPRFALGSSTSTVVISQVYGGGGNAGAPLRNDFIEIFNRGIDEVDVTGWSVQYASSTGSFNAKTDLIGKIPPGGYQLIQEAVGASITAPLLPTPDAIGTIAMGAASGKVALVRSTTALGCGATGTTPAPCSAALQATIADLVGFGTAATLFEGTGPTANLANGTAAFRTEHGCMDSDDNRADFSVAAPAPRNSSTLDQPCDSGPVDPPGPVATVTIAPSASTVFLGTTRQFAATGADAAGRTSPSSFTWVSSDPAILAFADPTKPGLASTPGGQGSVTITATAANGVPGTTTAFVTEPGGVGAITISIDDPRRIPVGYTKPAFPTSRDAGGVVISNPPPTLVWSSSNTAVATVDQLGYITGVGIGSATIRATAVNGVSGANSITVVPATAATSAVYRNHVEFGIPADGDAADDHIMSKPQYVISYNKVRGAPNWVSSNLNASHFDDAPRCDCFSADQTLPADFYHVVDFDYRNSNYNRGHMVQSEARTTTEQENAATFLLTNIVPQAGENNSGPWSRLENHLNDLARTGGKEIYIVTGGQYAANPGTLKNEGRVHIPDYTWKVAVIMNAGQGLANVTSASSLQVIAVRMPNLITPGGPASAVGISGKPWQDYETTVNSIEDAIGYDLLSSLPDRIEQVVEGGHEPVARLSGPTDGVEGTQLSFSGGSSTDADGDQLVYQWSFGDGATATGSSASRTYADNGSYTVALTVTDPSGGTSTAEQVVDITNAKPVVTSLTANSIVSGGTVSALASFTDAGTRDNPWTYSFSWGSGSPAVGISQVQGSVGATRSFSAAGSYTLSFSVTDKDGGTSVRTTTFQVSRLASGLLVSPEQVNISNNGNGQIKVVVLGSAAVDASLIDVSSARIGRTAVDAKGNLDYKSQLKDVDGDGQTDLELHFERGQLVRNGDMTAATSALVLLANLTDGRQISATGPVEVK